MHGESRRQSPRTQITKVCDTNHKSRRRNLCRGLSWFVSATFQAGKFRWKSQSQHNRIWAIRDINLSPRQKRGLGSLIDNGLAWGFNLATAGDVDQLRSLSRQVLYFTEKALTASTVGQNIVTRIGKLTTARFDKIDALLNLTSNSLRNKNQRLQNFSTSDYMTQRIIIIITQELSDLIA